MFILGMLNFSKAHGCSSDEQLIKVCPKGCLNDTKARMCWALAYADMSGKTVGAQLVESAIMMERTGCGPWRDLLPWLTTSSAWVPSGSQ
jgi:hypothetical protein